MLGHWRIYGLAAMRISRRLERPGGACPPARLRALCRHGSAVYTVIALLRHFDFPEYLTADGIIFIEARARRRYGARQELGALRRFTLYYGPC